MSSNARIEPFGLTFRVPLPPGAERSAVMRTAVYDQQRQMAVFNGRPLSELSVEERMVTSSPTENDGDSPISVDSDPFYDN